MLVVTQFGFPKLIRALEAMPDTVDVSFTCLYTHYNNGYHTLIVPPFQLVGKGPSRIAILKKTVPPRAGIYMYVHVCMYKHYIQCTCTCIFAQYSTGGIYPDCKCKKEKQFNMITHALYVFVSPPTVNSKQFEDEVTALLESTHNQRLSVIELTKAYNEVFRNQAHKKDVKLPPISEVEMVETLRKMPRFSVRH